MAYESLISAIEAVITSNGNNEITGEVLRDLLTSNVVPILGAERFKGLAEPSTVPGTPEHEEFYVASVAGTYGNFGHTITDGLFFFIWNGASWSKIDASDPRVSLVDGKITTAEANAAADATAKANTAEANAITASDVALQAYKTSNNLAVGSIDSKLRTGLDAYTHASEVELLTGGNTVDLIPLDDFIRANRKKVFAMKPHAIADGILPIQVGGSNMTFSRSGNNATYEDRDGVVRDATADYPRRDYSNGDEPSLLIEDSSTNLLENNRFIGATSGQAGAGTLPTGFTGVDTADIIVSPSLYENGNKIRIIADATYTYMAKSFSMNAGTKYCFSAIVKNNLEARFDRYFIITPVGTNSVQYKFNGENVLASDLMPLGIGLLEMVITTVDATTTTLRMGVGVGGSTTGDLEIDMPMWENKPRRTSNIPTGVGEVASRSADTCLAGSFTKDITRFKACFKFSKVQDYANQGFSLNDGTDDNRWRIYTTADGEVSVRGYKTGVEIFADVVSGVDVEEIKSLDLMVTDYDVTIGINGVEVSSTTISLALPTVNRFDFRWFLGGLERSLASFEEVVIEEF